jgi:hypothetical protein
MLHPTELWLDFSELCYNLVSLAVVSKTSLNVEKLASRLNLHATGWQMAEK